MKKTPTRSITSFRLSIAARRMLAGLAAHMGVSRTACLELAIRELARAQGVK